MNNRKNTKSLGKKRKNKQLIKKLKKQIGEKNLKIVKTIGILLSIILFFLFTLNIRLNGNKYRVQAITIAEINNTQKNSNEILDLIQKSFYNENYIKLKLSRKKSITKEIQSTKPIIKSIEVKEFINGRLELELTYNEPQIILITENQTGDQSALGIYNNMIYTLQTGTNKYAGTYTIHIPEIYNINEGSKGIFHMIKIEQLIDYLNKIYDIINVEKVEYHLGGSRFIIYENQKRYFIHLQKDIQSQLEKFNDIKKNLENRNSVQEVDLSSAEKPIIKLDNTS